MRLSCISIIAPIVCGIAVSVLAADHAFRSYARSTDVQYNRDPSVGVAKG